MENYSISKFGICICKSKASSKKFDDTHTHNFSNYKTLTTEAEVGMMEEELVCCLMGHKMRSTLPQDGAKCAACARSSSESGEASYYTCSECKIVIHRECAQLPKQIDHPMHPEHPLLLLAKPPYQSKTRFPYVTCQCQVCKKDWKNFVYHCPSCDFDVDVLCAFLENDVNNVITIPTHHHPVRLIRRPAKFRCNACIAQEMDNESYLCTKPSCGFWIHKKCGLSTELFKRPDHVHPLQLAIRMPHRYRKYDFSCGICYMSFGSSDWLYYCKLCKYFIHINCIKRRSISSYFGTDNDDDYGSPPRLAMIRELKTITEHKHEYLKEQEEDRRLPEIKNVDSHRHSLLLTSDHHIDGNQNQLICDGCILSIDSSTSTPHYICGQKCDFSLHTTCANLPQHRVMAEHKHKDGSCPKMELHFPTNPLETLKCRACTLSCDGYGYRCTTSHCDYYVDIKCSYLVGAMKHIGHPEHHIHSFPYSFSYQEHHISSYTYWTCIACGLLRTIRPRIFCSHCIFLIEYDCAALPATVTHRWDKHPLILTFPPFFRDSPDADEEFYCEVCEEEIHPKNWIYRCAECDQSFHPRCIPTLGECRNIKFGKVFRIQSHPHPLTSVPQARLTSKCYYCRKLLNWSRAYQCATCGFCLCPDCMPKEELVME